MDFLEIAQRAVFFFVPLLFALCFHEFAHGQVALWRGDNTAKLMGRLTMNPIAHMDLLGTVILPILTILSGSSFLFAWAKPVPVNSRNLKNPRIDMFWIALAGPASNVFLALVGALVMGLYLRFVGSSSYTQTIVSLLDGFLVVNLFLAVFNMIPLHPLDGGKVLARFLPASLNYKLEQHEQTSSLILMGLLLMGAFKILAIPVFWTHGILKSLVIGIAG